MRTAQVSAQSKNQIRISHKRNKGIEFIVRKIETDHFPQVDLRNCRSSPARPCCEAAYIHRVPSL